MMLSPVGLLLTLFTHAFICGPLVCHSQCSVRHPSLLLILICLCFAMLHRMIPNLLFSSTLCVFKPTLLLFHV